MKILLVVTKCMSVKMITNLRLMHNQISKIGLCLMILNYTMLMLKVLNFESGPFSLQQLIMLSIIENCNQIE